MNQIFTTQPVADLKVDLHCHSNSSDGELTPQELVLRASNQQVDVLALTDHDTIAGLRSAYETGQKLNPKVQIISGVEISCAWHGLEIHIVGLGFDPDDESLNALLEQQGEKRLLRAKTIAVRLQQRGLEDCWNKVCCLAGEAQITRAHFARLLVKEGWVSREKIAFKKYLRKGRKAYVSPPWCSIEEAIHTIHQAGGISVLAHPLDYKLSGDWTEKLFQTFSAAGGVATEVAQCQQTPNERQKLTDFANKYNLLASQGSDFHFVGSRRELGRSLKLPEGLQPVWSQWLATFPANQ